MEQRNLPEKNPAAEQPAPGQEAGEERGRKKRFCRKCLTREMDQGEYFRNLQEYIANLDPDLKVGEWLYEERLNKCRECEMLMEGMCRICGCYVELRAVMKKNRCPMVRPAWERVKEGTDL